MSESYEAFITELEDFDAVDITPNYVIKKFVSTTVEWRGKKLQKMAVQHFSPIFVEKVDSLVVRVVGIALQPHPIILPRRRKFR